MPWAQRTHAYNTGVWSIDAITKPDFKRRLRRPTPDDEFLRRTAIARLVRYTDYGPGLVRYIYADVDTILGRGTEDPEQSARILRVGRSFEIRPEGIQLSIERAMEVFRARRFHRFPLLMPNNINRVLGRSVETEVKLRNRAESALKAAKRFRASRLKDDLRLTSRSTSVSIHILAVGQGDSIFIVLPNGSTWLVDAYWTSKVDFSGYMSVLGINRIDKMFVSHYHQDHIGRAQQILDDYHPQVIVADVPPHTTSTCSNFLDRAKQLNLLFKVEGRQSLTIDGLRVELTPTTVSQINLNQNEPNDNGLIIKIMNGKTHALLSGDVPAKILYDLESGSQIQNGNVGLYKVTHHCSVTGNHAGFFNCYEFQHAATSCGTVNKFGHPHDPPDNTLDRLTGNHHRITCEEGCLSFRLTKDSIYTEPGWTVS